MENLNLSEKHHSYPAVLSLADFRSKLGEKPLNITPLDIAAYWMGKDSFQGSSVSLFHSKMVLLFDTICKCQDAEYTVYLTRDYCFPGRARPAARTTIRRIRAATPGTRPA